jgi:hypothetical protein
MTLFTMSTIDWIFQIWTKKNECNINNVLFLDKLTKKKQIKWNNVSQKQTYTLNSLKVAKFEDNVNSYFVRLTCMYRMHAIITQKWRLHHKLFLYKQWKIYAKFWSKIAKPKRIVHSKVLQHIEFTTANGQFTKIFEVWKKNQHSLEGVPIFSSYMWWRKLLKIFFYVLHKRNKQWKRWKFNSIILVEKKFVQGYTFPPIVEQRSSHIHLIIGIFNPFMILGTHNGRI